MIRSRQATQLAVERLNPADFYDPANREIFAAMKDMAGESRPVDLVTLDAELTRRGRLDAVGGAAYLVELTQGVPSAANVQAYIRIVDEKSTLRRLISAADQILQDSYAGQKENQEILEARKRRSTTSPCARAARSCSPYSRCWSAPLKRSSSW